MRRIVFVVWMGLAVTISWAAEKPSLPRGEIRMSRRNGGSSQEFRYRYNATQLRIDRPGEIIPSPAVNLLELKKGELIILHPHNGTCEQRALDEQKNGPSHQPARPPAMEGVQKKPHKTPPADWPEMPGMPQNLPEGIGPNAGSAPVAQPPAGMPPGMPAGMPAFPEMPAFPMGGMGGDESMVLVSKNQTNEFFGFSCQLFEVNVPSFGTLQLWLCDDPSLPPFHRLRHELLRRHGQPNWDEQVAQLLRKEKMFPFHAELKAEGGDQLAEWRVLSIKTDVKESDQTGIFDIPADMHLLPSEAW